MADIDQATTFSLADITRREVDLYAGSTHQANLYALHDDRNQRYAVIVVPDNPDERPAWVLVMARIEGDVVVIEEDTSLDKPLVDALIVNGGIPRQQITLAYKGETAPTKG